jgi:hypothetical protein
MTLAIAAALGCSDGDAGSRDAAADASKDSSGGTGGASGTDATKPTDSAVTADADSADGAGSDAVSADDVAADSAATDAAGGNDAVSTDTVIWDTSSGDDAAASPDAASAQDAALLDAAGFTVVAPCNDAEDYATTGTAIDFSGGSSYEPACLKVSKNASGGYADTPSALPRNFVYGIESPRRNEHSNRGGEKRET